MLRKLKIYADTSVYGGVFDDEFKEHSVAFFENIIKGAFKLYISDAVKNELANAPKKVRDFAEKFNSYIEVIDINEEAISFQQKYIESGIVSSKYITDALHVALSTISDCDIIVSWNFNHIVNFKRIPLYNSVNMKNGYKHINIYLPLEMIYEDET